MYLYYFLAQKAVYRMIVPVAAILAVVVAAGMAPASAYFPLDRYDTETADADAELTVVTIFPAFPSGVFVNPGLQGFERFGVDYTFTIHVCPDDGRLPGTPYGGTCTTHTSSITSGHTGISALFDDAILTNNTFVTMFVSPPSDIGDNWFQAVLAAGPDGGFTDLYTVLDPDGDLPPVGVDVTCTVGTRDVIKPSLTGDTTECNTPIMGDPDGTITFTNIVVGDPPPPGQRHQQGTGGWPPRPAPSAHPPPLPPRRPPGRRRTSHH